MNKPGRDHFVALLRPEASRNRQERTKDVCPDRRVTRIAGGRRRTKRKRECVRRMLRARITYSPLRSKGRRNVKPRNIYDHEIDRQVRGCS